MESASSEAEDSKSNIPSKYSLGTLQQASAKSLSLPLTAESTFRQCRHYHPCPYESPKMGEARRQIG